MLRITRDGAKMIDKKMEFKEDLLSRRKQEKLIFKWLVVFGKWIVYVVAFILTGIPMSALYYVSLTHGPEGLVGKIFLFVFSLFLHFLSMFLISSTLLDDDTMIIEDRVFFKLTKTVTARLEQIDSSIIDTTLKERTEIAEWFAENKNLIGIRKDSGYYFTLFYRDKFNDVKEENTHINLTPISREISKQMIKGYAYPISALLTYNAPSNEE